MLIGVIAEETLLPLVILPPRWVDGGILAQVTNQPDTFYQARNTVIGFLLPGLVDETTPLIGAERVGFTYITQDYRGIFPDLFADDVATDRFYDFFHGFVPVIRPYLWTDQDFTPIPDIGTNTQAVRPLGAFTDVDIIFSPSFRQGIAPAFVDSDDIIRPQIIRLASDPFVLLTDEFDDTDVFFAPMLARGLSPSLISDNDIFYAVAQVASLLPSAFTSADVFFAPFVVSQLQPNVIVDTETIFGPELRTPGRMGLVIDDDLFWTATVHFGALLPPLVTEADVIGSSFIGELPPLGPLDFPVDFDDTFYVPIVTQNLGLAPHLWIDVDSYLGVFGIILGQGMISAAFTDTDTFYVPAVPRVLTPALYSESEAFYVPTIFNVTQPLAPSWVIDTDNFFAPSLAQITGAQFLSASRATVRSVIVTSDGSSKVSIISNIGAAVT